jgi:hypothetical protein
MDHVGTKYFFRQTYMHVTCQMNQNKSFSDNYHYGSDSMGPGDKSRSKKSDIFQRIKK